MASGPGGDDGGDIPPGSGHDIPTSCEEASAAETTVGCLFFAVDLDTGYSDNDQYAAVVSNVQASADATVTIERKKSGAWQIVDGPQQIAAGDLHVFELPNNALYQSGVARGAAYRISSDVPVIAHQFNPLDGGSKTSDASMLYPATSWDTYNDVVGWKHLNAKHGAYVTVVAAHDGTVVEVTPSVPTAAGSPVPAGLPGSPFEIQLDEGDVLEVITTTTGDSITGTRIRANADHPVGVFSGHGCAYVPTNKTACDHLETQLSGVRLWGKRYAASRLPPREPSQPEAQVWQVYASEDGTTVSFSGGATVTGLPTGSVNLDAGQVLELTVTGSASEPGDFMVEGSKPIAVVGYMTGAQNLVGTDKLGDPAMLQLSPVEQFLPRYVLLVPNKWQRNYLVVTRPLGELVELDGSPLSDGAFTPIGQGLEVARVEVNQGVHELEAKEPFGIIVSGFDDWDSYAYLGGMGTVQINPTPAG